MSHTAKKRSPAKTLVKVRPARPADASAICRLGIADSSFVVSPVIKFYEQSEVAEWARRRRENLLLVAECDDEIVGFLFCKVMSHHWAMLDNFYVRPSSRTTDSAQKLYQSLVRELANRKLTYLTCLVREDHGALMRLVRLKGFTQRHQYTWLEYFLN